METLSSERVSVVFVTAFVVEAGLCSCFLTTAVATDAGLDTCGLLIAGLDTCDCLTVPFAGAVAPCSPIHFLIRCSVSKEHGL